MRSLFIFLIFAVPMSSYGAFGMLGNDQCSYPTSSFPTSTADNTQVIQAQIGELENNRIQVDAQINIVSGDLIKLQGYMRKYFAPRDANSPPWVDTMQAHMDNAMDCCPPESQQAYVTSQNSKYNFGKRFPAGNDYDGETVAPQPDTYRPEPAPVQAAPVDPGAASPSPSANSCCGYSSQYCSQDWARANYRPPPAGAAPVCLQTGFSATPAWYYGACRSGGEIDPQVCSDPRIASSPDDSKNCILVLDSYRKAAAQKRQLSSGLAQINIQIQGLKYPNRPSNGTSETTNGSALAGILGAVAKIALPLIFNQVASYQAEKDFRYRSVPVGAVPVGAGPIYRNNRLPPPPSATYYGPNYGYGFSNNGVYGGQPPAYQTGGFGCAAGTSGGGLNLMSLLFGGGRTNFNANGGIGATFGSNAGGLISNIGHFLFGGQNASVPSYRYGGYNSPYQVGGIYGVGGVPVGAVPTNTGAGNVSNYFNGGSAFPPAGSAGFNGTRLPPMVYPNSGRNGPPQSATLIYPQNNSSSYLGSNNYQTPYFGNMGSILSGMFNPSFNFNASASAQFSW